ncbi:hypothetical protein [Mannheimia haemolytica]|uniref:hypothetical protein n=1 Tax=Mannheimia haemolytica TaxID=75985 RepID=UPI000588C7DA|nr:hypothetical protein [Mannheimia haemolytica]AJE09179.1 hypothetical protein B824_23840 [Mannheimia haemolytica USDA-ARS-USMARC-184]UQX62723.1 hypothetical protein M3709_11300 [Mannheimia haemolytica]
MKSILMWLFLLGLEITLHFLDRNLTILVSLGVVSIYAMLFLVKEIFLSIDARFLFCSILPITIIYLYNSDINIWWIVIYIVLVIICYRMIKVGDKEWGDVFIAITVLFTWISRDVPLSYKIAAPIIIIISFGLLQAIKEEMAQKEINKSRKVVYIEGCKQYVPQCKQCSSYNTECIVINELSTRYGRTEAYTESRAFRDVTVARRLRYTSYELQYKCNNCNAIDSTNVQVRTREYL